MNHMSIDVKQEKLINNHRKQISLLHDKIFLLFLCRWSDILFFSTITHQNILKEGENLEYLCLHIKTRNCQYKSGVNIRCMELSLSTLVTFCAMYLFMTKPISHFYRKSVMIYNDFWCKDYASKADL